MYFFRKHHKIFTFCLLFLMLFSGLLMPIEEAKAVSNNQLLMAQEALISTLLICGVQFSSDVSSILADIYNNMDSVGMKLVNDLSARYQFAKATGLAVWEITKTELASLKKWFASIGISSATGSISGNKYADISVASLEVGTMQFLYSDLVFAYRTVLSKNPNLTNYKNELSTILSHPYMYYSYTSSEGVMVFNFVNHPMLYDSAAKQYYPPNGYGRDCIEISYGSVYNSAPYYTNWCFGSFRYTTVGLNSEIAASNYPIYENKSYVTGANAIPYSHNYTKNDKVYDTVLQNLATDSISLNIPKTDNPTLADVVGLPVAGAYADNVIINGSVNPPINPPINPPVNPPIDKAWYDQVLTGVKDIATSVSTNIGALSTSLTTAFSDAIGSLKDSVTSVPQNPALNFDKFKNLVVFKKFPFCIPFDFVNAVKVFAVSASNYQFKINFNTDYYKINHVVDLTPLAIPIGFFRYVSVVWFGLILILKTRDLIKW